MAIPRRRRGAPDGAAALNDDTIVARSSGAPPAAIGIIRISGPHAFAVSEALAGPLPPPRRASLRALRDRDGELLDRALVLVFPAAGSATAEDMVELHCHGGRAVMAVVEQAVLAFPGVRAAEAGEFTRRGLLNGRVDLSQAQGLADLMSAETEQQRRLAIRAAEGDVSRAIRGWLDRLTTMAASLEASIDYGEEGDVIAEATSFETVRRAQAELADEMAAVLDAPAVERLHEGWRIVLAGPPNAGKSTLLNLLAQRDAAIVSPIAGTTRDVIEVAVQRDGIGYILIDTAGRRGGNVDPIERAGIERAEAAAAGADLVLWLGDDPPERFDASVIRVHARSDLDGRELAPEGALAVRQDDASSVERLWEAIAARIGGHHIVVLPLHRRERDSVRRVVASLRRPVEGAVLAAEELRFARRELGVILGIDASETLYDRIFASFCVGK